MDAALREKIDQLGSVAEQFKSVAERVNTMEQKQGSVPSDLKEQLERVNQAVSAASEAKAAADKLQRENEEQAKRLSQAEGEAAELQRQIEELASKSGRPGARGGNPDVEAHKAGFNAFMRKGNEDGLHELERKALQTGVDADGGYAVPEEVDMRLIEFERDGNPMRSVSGQLSISTPDYKKLVNLGGAASGWVGEDDTRTETDTPTIAQLPAFMGEVYANPASTQTALDDMAIDVEGWLAREVAIQFADQENTAFTSGNGTNKPKGILAYATAATTDKAGTRPFGTLQELTTEAAAAVSGDDLINTVHALRSGYRSNATWMMTNMTLAAIRKLKVDSDNYLWRPGLEEGQPDRILGYRVVENEDLPEITDGAGSEAVLFGDFSRGYLVIDRIGTRVLRDPFTKKPYVFFYTTKRVGGMLVDSLAIKVLGIKSGS